MLFGILFSFWGIWPGQNDFFKDIGMVVALFGVTTLLAGWRVMRVAWFPIAFLLCGVRGRTSITASSRCPCSTSRRRSRSRC